MDDWQQMETAPRDGTIIEVVMNDGYTQAFYQDGYWWWHNTATESIAVGPKPECWRQLQPNAEK